MADAIYTLSFDGRAGDDRDMLCRELIEQNGGHITASGTLLISDPPVRDLDFAVPADQAAALVTMLVEAGFKPELRE